MTDTRDVVNGSTTNTEKFGRVTRPVIAELRDAIGAQSVLDDPADLATYAYDGTFLELAPDLIVFPQSTAQVAAVLRIAYRNHIPIVTRGAGSGLAGGSVAVAGGIILSTTRMVAIVEIDDINMCVTVQPGVVTATMQDAVARHKLLYPPDPASAKQSTIGGNIGMGAGGSKGLKYGTTKDYVLGLTVVLANGDILRTGGKMIKNVTGYNLINLFVGSEGTLGVVTEAILRLIPQPEASLTALAVFDHVEDAAALVTAVLSAGIVPATIELIDHACIVAVEQFKPFGLPLDCEAVLLIEVDGDSGSIPSTIAQVGTICTAGGAREVRVARSPAESLALWEARRAVSPSVARLRPTKLGEDISVPRSAIPAMCTAIADIALEFALPIPVFGHISDGNLHPQILFDRHDPNEVIRVNAAASAIFKTAVDLGGTLSGEHGIGSLKRDYVAGAIDPVALAMMRTIKDAFDPTEILNPGKVFAEG